MPGLASLPGTVKAPPTPPLCVPSVRILVSSIHLLVVFSVTLLLRKAMLDLPLVAPGGGTAVFRVRRPDDRIPVEPGGVRILNPHTT